MVVAAPGEAGTCPRTEIAATQQVFQLVPIIAGRPAVL